MFVPELVNSSLQWELANLSVDDRCNNECRNVLWIPRRNGGGPFPDECFLDTSEESIHFTAPPPEGKIVTK